MPVTIVNLPPIADSEIVFNEEESAQILNFFWPTAHIAAKQITLELRRLAQQLLIAAIDSSYAMGFIEAIYSSYAKPFKSLKSLAQRLAKRFMRHHWKHAKAEDLRDVKIYESIRVEIAIRMRTTVEEILNGLAVNGKGRMAPFYATATSGGLVWV